MYIVSPHKLSASVCAIQSDIIYHRVQQKVFRTNPAKKKETNLCFYSLNLFFLLASY